MEAIETIFENYKAAHQWDTPMTEGQREKLDALESRLDSIGIGEKKLYGYKDVEGFFYDAIDYGTESEKCGFVAGFKWAVNIMQECGLWETGCGAVCQAPAAEDGKRAPGR